MNGDDSDHGRNQHYPYWEKACEDYYQPLITGARRLTNGKLPDAEDLVQETFCRALLYWRNPDEIRNPLSYLRRMLRHVWIDKWTKENTANIESLDNLLSTGKHPMVEPDILHLLESEDLQKAVNDEQEDFTPREKLLLRLYFSGYKCKEIALRLNEDARLTRSDLNAVKAKIRYRLKQK